jgi:hypothetical protein
LYVASFIAVLSLTHVYDSIFIDYEARTNPEAPSSLFVLSGDAHTHRRRLWNRAMNTESLKAYHEIIARRASQLVDHLTGTATLTPTTSTHDGTDSGCVIDIAAWMGYVT